MPGPRQLLILLALLTMMAAPPAAAQGTLVRSPNLSGGWTGEAAQAYFNFLHRFTTSGPPERQVINRPTFLLAWSLGPVLLGTQYATRSDVEQGMPNEWEPFARWRIVRAGESEAGAVVAVTAAYNQPAAALDGEVTGAAGVGPLRFTGALRVLGGTAGRGARAGAGAGLVFRATSYAALAVDFFTLQRRDEGERMAWGAGVQLRIPTTPHTLSLHATNTGSGTLRASSRGGSEARYGFEFTVPITLRRYFTTARAAGPPLPGDGTDAGAGEAEVRARIVGLAYAPDSIVVAAGTTIEWTNGDPLEHTVTAVDGSWDSGPIGPGAVWRRTFAERGTHRFHCTPHPFMTGVVVVR
jgi:plastocyanin